MSAPHWTGDGFLSSTYGHLEKSGDGWGSGFTDDAWGMSDGDGFAEHECSNVQQEYERERPR
mgnify:CR=1 FL=1